MKHGREEMVEESIIIFINPRILNFTASILLLITDPKNLLWPNSPDRVYKGHNSQSIVNKTDVKSSFDISCVLGITV